MTYSPLWRSRFRWAADRFRVTSGPELHVVPKRMGALVSVLSAMVTVCAAAPASLPKSADELADVYAQAILMSHDAMEVRRKLHVASPEIVDPSQVLPSLFGRVSRGGATDSHWAALCRVDTWGDGAWHLEIKGSAFDGLALNPAVFSQRYVDGDDCALLLLSYAYAWPLEAPDVGGIDCSREGAEEVERFKKVFQQSMDAITRLGPAKSDARRTRLRILVGVASMMEDALLPTLQRFQESCAKEPK